MWFAEKTPVGNRMIRFHGRAGYDPYTNEGISILIPFNFIYVLGQTIWFKLKKGSSPKVFMAWHDAGFKMGMATPREREVTWTGQGNLQDLIDADYDESFTIIVLAGSLIPDMIKLRAGVSIKAK